MDVEEIFANIKSLQTKFSNLFKQRKQLRALENYSAVKAFSRAEHKVFSAITYCLKGEFIQPEDADWISTKLEKLEINYLDWTHKTKWLKEQMALKAPVPSQVYFDFCKEPPIPFAVPTHLLVKAPKRMGVSP